MNGRLEALRSAVTLLSYFRIRLGKLRWAYPLDNLSEWLLRTAMTGSFAKSSLSGEYFSALRNKVPHFMVAPGVEIQFVQGLGYLEWVSTPLKGSNGLNSLDI